MTAVEAVCWQSASTPLSPVTFSCVKGGFENRWNSIKLLSETTSFFTQPVLSVTIWTTKSKISSRKSGKQHSFGEFYDFFFLCDGNNFILSLRINILKQKKLFFPYRNDVLHRLLTFFQFQHLLRFKNEHVNSLQNIKAWCRESHNYITLTMITPLNFFLDKRITKFPSFQ